MTNFLAREFVEIPDRVRLIVLTGQMAQVTLNRIQSWLLIQIQPGRVFSRVLPLTTKEED